MKKRILSVLLAVVLVISVFSVAIFANSVLNKDYSVTVSSTIENGSISVDKTKANEGDVVEVTITPNKGYITKAGTTTYTYSDSGIVTRAIVTRVDENAIGEKLCFNMPAKNVTVYAEFVSIEEYNFSFDVVASSVKSADETFKAGSFDTMRFVSRLYFEANARNIETGALAFKKDGEEATVTEIGTLYAKSETLGAENELTLSAVGTNGIENAIAYSSATPLEDNFVDITRSYVDFAAEIAIDNSQTDYSVKSYVKFSDGIVLYSKERTDFADNVAARLGLCETDDSAADVTLTVSESAVNTTFEGFGAVMYPWTTTCRQEGVNIDLAKIKARKEIRLMSEAGIKKVRLIVPTFPIDYYDLVNKQAVTLKSDWYTDLWVEMLNTLKTYGINVELNFGWGTELANSMKLGKFNSVLGGDYDKYLTFDEQVTAYGQLSAELTRYLISAGCTNIKSATFLSEPGNGWSGTNWLDTKLQSPQLNFETAISAYDACAKSVQTEFAKANITGVKFTYGNVSLLYDPTVVATEEGNKEYHWWDNNKWSTWTILPGKDWVKTMINKSTATVDSYSYHYYGKFNSSKVSNYAYNKAALDAIATDALTGTGITPNDIYMDEVSVKYFGTGESSNNKSIASPYEATQLAEYLATLMNGGYKGAYLWTFSDFASNNMFGLMPNAISAVKGNGVPYDRYYATTLVTKYLNGCKTIYAGTQDDGCLTVMGKDANDKITVLVVNMNNVNKTVKVNLSSALSNETLNRHIYNPSVNYRTIEAKIIGVDKKFENVSTSFTDTIPAGGVAIYTTK